MKKVVFSQLAKAIKNINIPISVNKKEIEKSVEQIFYDILYIDINEEDILLANKIESFYNIIYNNACNLILEKDAEESLSFFIKKLFYIKKDLYEDAQSLFDNDPAANSIEEVIVSYPSFFTLFTYRISHELYLLKIPIIPRLISEYAHSKTGIDIHPGAVIGKSFFLDHGTGVVIGETAIIGNNVKIYQGVTLGALSVTKNMVDRKRHPTIESNVTIYAGATILGGDTVIGHDSIIGGNAWITQSVEPYSTVIYSSKMKFQNNSDYIEPINYTI